MPHMAMLHEDDPAQKLRDAVGDISGVELFHNQVLLATYLRPTQTKGGLHLPSSHVDEDKYQSKVGLVLAVGPQAFDDPEGKWFQGVEVKVGDWVVFRPADGWQVTVNKQPCRMLTDVGVRARLSHPDLVY